MTRPALDRTAQLLAAAGVARAASHALRDLAAYRAQPTGSHWYEAVASIDRAERRTREMHAALGLSLDLDAEAAREVETPSLAEVALKLVGDAAEVHTEGYPDGYSRLHLAGSLARVLGAIGRARTERSVEWEPVQWGDETA